MTISTLDGVALHRLLTNGSRNLQRNRAAVDALNVFPVPDGDTGKNMSMTIEGGVSASAPLRDVGQMMEAVSHGTLLSARGNSGVILSQFISGLADGLAGQSVCTPASFHAAMACGVTKSYEAVIHPVEGTMLTVMRQAVESVTPGADFTVYFEQLLEAMRESLTHTPELLDVLKQAGVVDSGGAGMVCIFEGMLLALNDRLLDADEPASVEAAAAPLTTLDPSNLLVYGYCTEFILQLQPSKVDVAHFDLRDVISQLEALGESIVAVADRGLLKVHIHSFEPEKVIAFARTMGEFLSIKIENMSVQHHETMTAAQPPAERVPLAVVATAQGLGIAQCFREIGAAYVIDGGQTNNPSTQAFLEAFRQVNADHIIVLPNNANLILTARQAAELFPDSDVRVLETKSIAEGYSALSMLDPTAEDVDAIIDGMTQYLPYVTTCYVTNATRDAVLNGLEIRRDDFIGLTDDAVLSTGSDRLAVTKELLSRLPDIDDKQVVTVFYGKGVPQQELEALERQIKAAWPLIEVYFLDGSQELYSYIISAE